jgi:hypothetical protein
MQDKTINNALLALRREGGSQGMLAEVLLDMRGVDMPAVRQFQPFARGSLKRMMLERLSERPHTASELASMVQEDVPSLNRKTAFNRAYQALLRLQDRGLVRREGRGWLKTDLD